MKSAVNLLNEIGMLAKTPRTGFAFLGSGLQSVAEHSFRVAIIGCLLADLIEDSIDKHKLLLLCLFHDLPESRTGDLNYVYKRYVKPNDAHVLEDIRKSSQFGEEIVNYITEFEEGNSLEAQLAKDADQLEMLLVLKQESDIGNLRALEWFEIVSQRIKTEIGQKLAKSIKTTPSDDWWISNKQDPHWIHGGKTDKSKEIPNSI